MAKIEIEVIQTSIGLAVWAADRSEQYFSVPSGTSIETIFLCLDAYNMGKANALAKPFTPMQYEVVQQNKIKTKIYYLLCEAGKSGGFGPYIGFDSIAGFKLKMVTDRTNAKRYFDRAEADADALKLEETFCALEVEERIGSL